MGAVPDRVGELGLPRLEVVPGLEPQATRQRAPAVRGVGHLVHRVGAALAATGEVIHRDRSAHGHRHPQRGTAQAPTGRQIPLIAATGSTRAAFHAGYSDTLVVMPITASMSSSVRRTGR